MQIRILLPLTTFLLMAGSIPGHAQSVGVAPNFVLSPNPAPASQAFALQVFGREFDCNSRFSNQSVKAAEGRIDLSFVTRTTDIPIPCRLDANPVLYGPKFEMAALKEGKYRVFLQRLLPCHVTDPACRVAVREDSAGVLVVGGNGTISYLIQPEQVKPNLDFELALLSYQFTCGTTYDRLNASVAGGRIDLTFLDHAHPEVVCPMIYKPYGPSYKMKALKAGTYPVYAVRLPACIEQGCKIRPVPQFVGNLVVGDEPSRGWFLKDDVVKPNAPFTMQLLNQGYGNCNTDFTHATATLNEFTQSPSIFTTFAIESHPERICVVDLRPWGPTFQLPALKPGRYPVHVTILPACYFTEPRCLIPIKLPEVVDTLLVSANSAVLASSSRSGGAAVLQGDRLSFSLPEGAGGAWQVELFAPSGKRLYRFPAEGNGSSRVEKKIDGGLRQGVYLLRMRGAGGEIRTQRIPLQK